MWEDSVARENMAREVGAWRSEGGGAGESQSLREGPDHTGTGDLCLEIVFILNIKGNFWSVLSKRWLSTDSYLKRLFCQGEGQIAYKKAIFKANNVVFHIKNNGVQTMVESDRRIQKMFWR